jgi:hypothetical protein
MWNFLWLEARAEDQQANLYSLREPRSSIFVWLDAAAAATAAGRFALGASTPDLGTEARRCSPYCFRRGGNVDHVLGT